MYYIYIDNLSWNENGELNSHSEQLLYMPRADDLLVLNPKLTMEVNKAGSLEFKMPYKHVLIDEIHEMRTTVIVRRNSKIIWKGRITKIERDFYKNASVYCEGALAFLNDTLVPAYQHKETPTTVQALFEFFITEHAKDASPGRKIQLANPSCDVTKVSWEIEHYPELVDEQLIDPSDININVENNSYPQTFQELTSVLVEEYGGYLYLTYGNDDTYYLGYYQNYGGVSQNESRQAIQFGINLLDYAETKSAEDLFTRFRPIGASDITVSSLMDNGSEFIENIDAVKLYGKISRTESWSEIEDKNELLRKGRRHLLEGSRLSQTIAIKAVDMQALNPAVDSIDLGDEVVVFSAPHKVNDKFMCSQIIIDMQDPSNTEYVFGDVYTTLTGTRITPYTNTIVVDSADDVTF